MRFFWQRWQRVSRLSLFLMTAEQPPSTQATASFRPKGSLMHVPTCSLNPTQLPKRYFIHGEVWTRFAKVFSTRTLTRHMVSANTRPGIRQTPVFLIIPSTFQRRYLKASRCQLFFGPMEVVARLALPG
jgi:hypothetical protein